MKTRSATTKTTTATERLTRVLAAVQKWLVGPPPAAPPPEPPQLRPELILGMEVYVEARCPCGSAHVHRLTLVSTADCVRCGRALAVRSIEYYRPTLEALPQPLVSVGYVVPRDRLAAQPTVGVH